MSRTSVVNFAQAQGFGSPLGSEASWKTALAPPTARAVPAQSARAPVGPTPSFTAPSTISTTLARPKPSNVAIPYARTAPHQIDCGEIVMVNTSVSLPLTALELFGNATKPLDHGQRMRVGVGATNSLCSVRTIEDVNKRLHALRWTGPDPSNEALVEALGWTVDGVAISSETEDKDGYNFREDPLVNVCVYGPTPLINDAKRRAFSLSENNVARLYVGLARLDHGNGEGCFQFVRFSTHDIMNHAPGRDPILGNPKIVGLSHCWCIGRIMDRKLNMKFQESALVHVNISPAILPPSNLPNGRTAVLERSIEPTLRFQYPDESDLLEALKNYVPFAV